MRACERDSRIRFYDCQGGLRQVEARVIFQYKEASFNGYWTDMEREELDGWFVASMM